jgi:hypothetical protein
MLIAHASIPSDNPKATAQALAEIMNGEAVRFFPGGPDAWMAWSGDGALYVEVIKRGRTLSYGPEQAEFRPGDGAEGRLTESHLAICVDRAATEIVEIARRMGWPARPAERGGYFSLVEVWVDGAFLIEFLDPAQTKVYAERVTLANWKALISSNAMA